MPIIEAMCTLTRQPRQVNVTIEANWKLCYHISLDDYHSPAVHPTTFGKRGYMGRKAFRYFRFGSHSAFFPGGDENALQDTISAMKEGSYRAVRYRIFQIFPNLLIALFRAHGQHFYVNVQQYVSVAPGQSQLRSWYYPAPFEREQGPLARVWSKVSDPIRTHVVEYYIRKLHSEDNEVVERLQRFATQQGGWPRIGYAEERIKWFEETYAKAMTD